MDDQKKFQWAQHAEAETFLLETLAQFAEKNGSIAVLAKDLEQKTSTRLFDWVDHFVVAPSPAFEKFGFEKEGAALHHPGALFPRIVLSGSKSATQGIAVSVSSISDFLGARGIHRKIDGSPCSGYRRCLIGIENEISLWVVERRGTFTMEPITTDSHTLEKYVRSLEKWCTRPRNNLDEKEGMEATLALARELIETMGQDMAAWIVLDVEREYWQRRNFAAQLQKMRQDQLGMGWANHDHHTFRSSRKNFTQLVRLFEMLGFHCRERYWAGQEAGWGAQVMENSNCNLVLFLDVDLSPKEVDIDFSRNILPERETLGTIGLWCALHGDSILQAGMHHLEAQFEFDRLRDDLAGEGVDMMQPFSDFTYLRQAFTKGELWPVDPKRIEKLRSRNQITEEQADKFLKEGAIGSHLENLQRRDGYKGFNQKNVSVIIKETDPRKIQL